MSTDDSSLSRRDVGKASLAAGVGLLVAGGSEPALAAPRKKRYAIVGVGSRSYMYQEAIHQTYAEHAELVAVCDTNAGRAKLALEFAKQHGKPEPAAYDASDFDKMVGQSRPDVVIVTTVDATHDDYIVRAMTLGCDVITEKPMTTDAAKCQRIIDAARADRQGAARWRSTTATRRCARR